jgi:hypothetical protein
MFEPEGYPTGSYNDPRAPWNESYSFITKECSVSETLCKDICLEVRDKSVIDKDDYIDSFLFNNYPPSFLIDEFKKALEYYKENKSLRYSDKEINSLIENCKGWKSEDFDVVDL